MFVSTDEVRLSDMHDPPFESLSSRQEQTSLSNSDVAFLLDFSEAHLAALSTPGPHELTRTEADRIMQLSIQLGRLLTILKPEAIRQWLFSPNPAYEGRTPANMIATGDMKRVNEFVAAVNNGLPN